MSESSMGNESDSRSPGRARAAMKAVTRFRFAKKNARAGVGNLALGMLSILPRSGVSICCDNRSAQLHSLNALMNISTAMRLSIRIALVESDPLRIIGFRSLLESEPDLDLIPASLPEIATQQNINLVLLGDRPRQTVFDLLSNLKAMCPNLPVIVIGSSTDDETMLSVIISGAKGYVFEGAPHREFAQAIRIVNQGSIWVPRRILSRFIDLAVTQRTRSLPKACKAITDREKQVLKMLVAGFSNKEIGEPLGIVERTVKAHIS